MVIGLRIYKIQLHRNNVREKIGSGVAATDLAAFTRNLIAKASSSPLDDGSSKVVRFQPEPDDQYSQHGLMRYGTYGFGSQVENVQTGAIAHNRTIDQADTIPLYYRFWFPPSYSYGLMATQSFGGRSCSDLVRKAFINAHSIAWPDYRMTSAKVMPNEINLYGRRPVKKITLIRKNAEQNIVSKALRPAQTDTEVDLEFSLRARGGGTFGQLKDLKQRLGGHLEVGDLEFSGAFAEVKVGSSYKKIGIVGVSSAAGVIDITDDVKIGADKHPTIASVAKATKKNLMDFSKLLGT